MSKYSEYNGDKKVVNPLYWEIDHYCKDPQVTEIFIFGGKGSSKSFTVCQYAGLKGITEGKSTLAFRKEQSRIKTTLKKTFKAALETLSATSMYEHLDFMFRANINERYSEIVLTGLDDEEKAKGVEGFDIVIMDELNQYLYQEYEQVSLSHRGKEGQILFGILNPVSDQVWVKKKLIDQDEWNNVSHTLPSPDSWIKVNTEGTRVLIKTDYRDNYWAVGSPCGTYGFRDEKLIRKYAKLKETNYNSWLVNVKGEWGLSQNKSPWFTNFSRDKNIKEDLKPIEGIPLSLGWDFNKGRMACVVGQKLPTEGIIILDCIDGILVEDTAMKVLQKYKGWNWGFHVYGDASGTNGSALTGSYHYYHEILKIMKLPKSVLKKRHKRKKNMQHSQSRVLVEWIMGRIPVYFDKENCGELIKEVERAETVVNEQTGKENLRKDDNLYSMDRVDGLRYLLENLLVDINETDRMRDRIEVNNPELIEAYIN